MTVVDVAILFVICLSVLFSLLRGFVKEAISLAAWMLALWLAITLAPKLATILPGGIESEAVRLAVSFGVLFVVTLIVGAIVNFMAARFIKKTGLSNADRAIGAGFGLIRGFLIIIVFVVVGRMTPLPEQEWWQESALLNRVELIAIWMQDYLPLDFGDSIPYDGITG